VRDIFPNKGRIRKTRIGHGTRFLPESKPRWGPALIPTMKLKSNLATSTRPRIYNDTVLETNTICHGAMLTNPPSEADFNPKATVPTSTRKRGSHCDPHLQPEMGFHSLSPLQPENVKYIGKPTLNPISGSIMTTIRPNSG
jgi:hypothetical protein